MTEGGARVTRGGTAIEIRSGSESRTIRRIDLAAELGMPTANSPRFDNARLEGNTLTVHSAGGATDTVALSEMFKTITVVRGGPIATMESGAPLVLWEDGAIVCKGGTIEWVGPHRELAGCGINLSESNDYNTEGRLITPGLIDCHAHPMFAGNRAVEFAKRAAGANYLDIAATGGGINATLIPTRAASVDDHVELTFERMAAALAAGTTTCEAKSGYALTVPGELMLLEAAARVDALSPVDLHPTLLGAHLVPSDRADDRDGYITDVVTQMIPEVARRGLAGAVDVYCDDGAFTLEETRRVLEAAKAAGLAVKAHVGQFADLGGPQLVAALEGLSVDHLEKISERGIAALGGGSVVAVMLPGACVQLGQTPPPVAKLRAAGVSMAVATDLNPGTSYCESLAVPMWLAVTHYGMTVDEVWHGVTRIAARALGRWDVGVLAPKHHADIVVWDAVHPAEIPYRFGSNLVHAVFKDGVHQRLGHPRQAGW